MIKTGEAAGQLPGLMQVAEHKTSRVHSSSDEAIRRMLRFAGGFYLLFLVYGSLVPLQFQAISLAEAWQSFRQIFSQALDFSASADRDANLLLYIPVGFFFASGWMVKRGAGLSNGFAALFVCAAVSIGVEFAQLFLPPRTSSLSDIVANTLGGGAGVALWYLVRARFMARLAEIGSGGLPAIRAMVTLYVTIYLAFSLFPYDFRMPAPGFGPDWHHFLINPSSCASVLLCGVKLAAEVVAASPLGILMGMMATRTGRAAFKSAWAYGLLLGLAIEGGQIFLESGVSQGVSILSRGAGMALGLALFVQMQNHRPKVRWPNLGKAVALVAALYLVLLAALNGWFTSDWLSWSAGLQKIDELRFVPFYYHYFTTETAALISVLVYGAMYAPVGLGVWAWATVAPGVPRKGAQLAALLAAGAAFIIEGGKLFIANKRPDPTDLLIAATAAAAAFALAALISRWLSDPAMPVPPVATPSEAKPDTRRGLRSASLALGALVGWAVLEYPLGPHWPGSGLALYALLLWRFPRLWLVVIPALVPLLNFSPWTGRIFLDEFDLVVLTTVAVGLWRLPCVAEAPVFTPAARWLVGLLAASCAIGLLIGLMPLQALDDNAFSSYLSHYNSLRAGKGFFMALLLLPLLKDCVRDPAQRWQQLVTAGMTLGAALLAAIVLWERWLFPGLLDFSTEYRVTAFFADMQTGGPQVETWVAMSLPFVAILFLSKPAKPARIFSLLAFAAAVYAGLVTFARGGYLGLAAAMLVLAAGMVLARGSKAAFPRRRGASVLILLVAAAVALPVISGSFIQSRFAQSGTDLGIRLAHWKSALAMIGADGYSKIFGMGLGTFPATYYLQNPQGIRPGNYRFEREDGNPFLRLNPGASYFIGQKADVLAATHYVLSLDLRSISPSPAKLAIHLCEKHVLYSFRCQALQFASIPGRPGWEHRELIFTSGEVGRDGRPAVLSFASPGTPVAIDVDNVHLTAPDGSELLANGSFRDGADRWFFTTDNGWPWRVENLWLQVLFEQGWLGVTLLGLLVVRQLYRLVGPVRRGDLFALGLLASLAGVLTVGLFGSVLESPRLAMMFFVLIFASELHVSRRRLE